MSANNAHPKWPELMDAIELRFEDRGEIASHVRSCVRCARVVEDAQRLLDGFQSARLEDPPTRIMDRTLARVLEVAAERRARTSDTGAGELLNRFMDRARQKIAEFTAVLVGDTLVPTHALRGMVSAVPRTLLFETDGYTITLSLTPGQSSDLMDIAGQLAPKRSVSIPLGSSAELQSGRTVMEDPLSEYGEFTFRGVRHDGFAICLLLPDETITFTPLPSPGQP